MGPGPKFLFTGPGLHFYYQSGVRALHILTLSPQFMFAFTALVYDLYYWSRAEYTFTSLLVVVVVVVVIVVVISLE